MKLILSDGESFKPIYGFETLYYITSNGRVWSLYVNRFLKLITDNDGYFYVGLHKRDLNNKNIQHNFRIHRLVANAFIENPNNFPVVNHKDTNKQNNHKDNLEWCTAEYNSNHAIINNLLNKKSTKYYGVYFRKTLGPRNKKHWFSRVIVNKKELHIGFFNTELEAAKSYDKFIINNNINRPLNFLKGS